MTETKPCTRGCGLLGRHLDDCAGNTPSGTTCRGCLPRRAEHGNLCWPCHRRLELMLTDAPTVHRWLTGNLGTGEGQAPDDAGWITGSKGDGPPAPIKVAIYDQRQLLADQLAAWADDLAEQKNLNGPDRHTVEADSEFLLTWLPGIEKFDWIGDWWDELAETLKDAHTLAPWRPTVKRIPRTACPECGHVNLIIFGGESDVTCGSCRTIIPEASFGLWERIFRDEQRGGAA